jgi:hypothetical protein
MSLEKGILRLLRRVPDHSLGNSYGGWDTLLPPLICPPLFSGRAEVVVLRRRSVLGRRGRRHRMLDAKSYELSVAAM